MRGPASSSAARWVIAVTLAVAAALVAVAARPVPHAAEPAAAGAGSPTFVSPRPAVNGSSRPPLSAPAQRAVEELAATSQLGGGAAHAHDGAGGHLFGPVEEIELAPVDAERFAEEWARAGGSTAALDTPEEAAAAGYVLSSTRSPGVGTHWVNWELISQPFDPARPSMLLFAPVRGVDRLVGYSYWVQGDRAPDGFAGPNDVWHTHSGLCVVNGWVEREAVTDADQCPGSWLAGADLWMLHAWTMEDFPNRWGRFAPTNPTLCPTGRVPDLASCRPDAG